MPYPKGANDPGLPPNVRRMSAKRRRQWLDTYNSEKASGKSDGDAIHMANGVIMRQMGHSMAKGAHDMTGLEGAGEVASAISDMYMPWEVQQRRVDQSVAEYNPFGADPSARRGCASCQFFISPDSCVVVSGDISPFGLSRFYEPDEDMLDNGADEGTESDIMSVQLVDEDGDPIDIAALLSAGMPMGGSMEGVSSGAHATWTQSYQNNLPDSAFAWIAPGGKKDKEGKTTPRDLRYFPYKDDAGKLDELHVRNALSRVPQAHVPSSAKHAALVKLHAAARSLGIKLSPVPAGGSSEAPSAPRGAYQKILSFFGLSDLPAPAPAVPASERSGFLPDGPMFSLAEDKTQPGRLRYWAVASNNFYDNKGKEFPSAAQQDYVDWVWRKPEERMAELQVWHTPGTRLGQDDWVDYDGHFLHSTGLIDAGKEELARRVASEPDLGMSHGYVVVWDQQGRAQGYRSWEKSILPRSHAGNSFTSFGLEEDTMGGFSEPRKEFLRRVLGMSDADIQARENRWEAFGTFLAQQGIGFHEVEMMVASHAADDGESLIAQIIQSAIAQAAGAQASAPAVAGAQAGAPATALAGVQGAAPVAAAPAVGSQAAPAMPTDTLTVQTLAEMVASIAQGQQMIVESVNRLQQNQSSVDSAVAASWRTAQGQNGFDAARSPLTIPRIVQDPSGSLRVVGGAQDATPPGGGSGAGAIPAGVAAGAQAAPVGAPPLDPKVLGVLARGEQGNGMTNDPQMNPLGWMMEKIKVNPLLTGGPTEHRG